MIPINVAEIASKLSAEFTHQENDVVYFKPLNSPSGWNFKPSRELDFQNPVYHQILNTYDLVIKSGKIYRKTYRTSLR